MVMGKSELLNLIESSLDVAPGNLHEDQILADLVSWDSMAALLVMGVAEEIGVPLSGDQIIEAQTVGDLVALLGHNITA